MTRVLCYRGEDFPAGALVVRTVRADGLLIGVLHKDPAGEDGGSLYPNQQVHLADALRLAKKS